MKHTIFGAAYASLLIAASGAAQAALLNTGDVLAINAGTQLLDASNNPVDVPSGSWFGMDMNGSASISGWEKTPLAMGTTGLVIGTTTTHGVHHAGCPVAGDTNAITAPWCFFGNTGSDFTRVGVTGGTTAGLNFSGWYWGWNRIDIPMNTGAWGTGFSNGIANFVWSGVYGDTYTLEYTATQPGGDSSDWFGGVRYYLHLEGTVQAAPTVPVPAAAWLLGSGLLGLIGVAQRKAV